MEARRVFLAGTWHEGAAGALEIRSPYDGAVVSRVGRADADQLAAAAATATETAPALAALSPAGRADILERAAALLRARREEAAALIVAEAGKPMTLARLEVERAVDMLTDSAHVARYPHLESAGPGRLRKRHRPAGADPAGAGGTGAGHHPVQLPAHAGGPQAGAGRGGRLPGGAQAGDARRRPRRCCWPTILAEAGLPAGALSVLPASSGDMAALVATARFKLLTFTGSAEVGWGLKREAWDRRVALELGGNAAAVVEPDAGDLAEVAQRLAAGALRLRRAVVHLGAAHPRPPLDLQRDGPPA